MTAVKHQALSAHVFMGGFSVGTMKHLDVIGQLEVFDLGQATAKLNLKVPLVQADAKDWAPLVHDLILKGRKPPIYYGNPRCTGFSCLNGGLSEDTRGPWAKQTRDINELFQLLPALGYKPDIIAFESVQQAGSVGRPLLEKLVEIYGAGYRVAELYHNAAQFGNSQHRRRVIFMLYNEQLQCPALEVTERHLWFNKNGGDTKHATVADVLREPCLFNTDATLLEFKERDSLTYDEVLELSPKIPGEFLRGSDAQFGMRLMNHYAYMQADDNKGGFNQRDTRELLWHQLLPGTSLNDLDDDQLEASPRHLETRINGSGFSLHATRRLHPDKATPVIYSASGHYLHPDFNRPLSIREMARLMGLPDDFILVGPMQISQLGKGVTVQVGDWFGELCNAMLNGEKRLDDTGTRWEIFRMDKIDEWVPKKPIIRKPFVREDD